MIESEDSFFLLLWVRYIKNGHSFLGDWCRRLRTNTGKPAHADSGCRRYMLLSQRLCRRFDCRHHQGGGSLRRGCLCLLFVEKRAHARCRQANHGATRSRTSGFRISRRGSTTATGLPAASEHDPPRHPIRPTAAAGVGRSSAFPDFAQIAAEIYNDLIERFAAYLSVYYQRGAGLAEGEAEAKAHQIAPAILAVMQGAIVQTTILGNESRGRITSAIEALLTELVD